MDEGAEDECDEQDGVCLDALVAHEDSDCSYTSDWRKPTSVSSAE